VYGNSLKTDLSKLLVPGTVLYITTRLKNEFFNIFKHLTHFSFEMVHYTSNGSLTYVTGVWYSTVHHNQPEHKYPEAEVRDWGEGYHATL
jgi:hypothetical protein